MKKITTLLVFLLFTFSCTEEETLQDPINFSDEELFVKNELDNKLEELFAPYNCRIIYKFIDGNIPNAYRAVPARTEFILPVAELVVKAWIEPFIAGANGDDSFIKRYFPSELVFVGSYFFNNDGTRVLGVAEAGVRVTVTNINSYDPDNKEWIKELFRTLTHEFAHIVDQNFGFDYGPFYELSGSDYTSPGSWSNLLPSEAIMRGMVTPYGTSSVSEDFAELVAFIVTHEEGDFADIFFDDGTACPINNQFPNCLSTKEGKQRIEEKYQEVLDFYANVVGIDLLKVRDKFLENIE